MNLRDSPDVCRGAAGGGVMGAMEERPFARDEMLSAFRAVCRARDLSAVQPTSILPCAKGLLASIILSASDDASADEKILLETDGWQLAGFQVLDSAQTDLINNLEHARNFPGGAAGDASQFLAMHKLNEELAPQIAGERKEMSDALTLRSKPRQP